MSTHISRRKLSSYYSELLFSGADTKKLALQLAAYLIDTKRTKELQQIISDIEYQLGQKGMVVANVTTAHTLDDYTKKSIIDLISSKTNASSVTLKEYLDKSLLGGMKLEFAGAQIDTTIARRLTALKTNYKR